jgi:HAD superfamily hydrolase (TIGR01509 family)
MTISAVVFDLDGVLIDSEPIWDRVRREYVEAAGGAWREDSQQAMMGMSTQEWSAYLSRDLGVGRPPADVASAVIAGVAAVYGEQPPLFPGAVAAVQSLVGVYLLGLASSSPLELIGIVLRTVGLASTFRATVSTEEMARGKPAPDVYLEAARRLGVEAARCAAVEDSANGLRAAAAAGMCVVAIPNPRYPPAEDALALADVTLPRIAALGPDVIQGLEADA